MSNGAVTRIAVTLNGISVAYLLGFTNAALSALMAFGVHMSSDQRVAVAGLVNAALILTVHLAHRVGEATASGASHQAAQDRVPEQTVPGK